MSGRLRVVDDEYNVRGAYRMYFEHYGYEVTFARTAVGALRAARTHEPDVILLDLLMPGVMTGEEVVRPLSRLAPVIVVSGIGDVEIAKRTLREGAFDYVTKPLSLPHLRELIDAALVFRARAAS